MRRTTPTFRAFCALSAVLVFGFSFHSAKADDSVVWDFLPSVPDEFGFAAPFAGSIDGALIVAGGANFPSG